MSEHCSAHGITLLFVGLAPIQYLLALSCAYSLGLFTEDTRLPLRAELFPVSLRLFPTGALSGAPSQRPGF